MLLFGTSINAFAADRDSAFCEDFGGVCGCDVSTGKQLCCEGNLNESYSCQDSSRLNYPSYAQAFPSTKVYTTVEPNDRGTHTVFVNWADQFPTEYSITLTPFPGADPGPFADTSEPSFVFYDVPTGIQYINIKKNIDGEWSQITSWKVEVPEWQDVQVTAGTSEVAKEYEDQKPFIMLDAPSKEEENNAATAEESEQRIIQDIPNVLFFILLFVGLLFVILILTIIGGRKRLKKLEKTTHKMRLDIGSIMQYLRGKFPQDKDQLVSHSRIQLNGELSREEKQIIKDTGFDSLYNKHQDYFIQKIKTYNPKNQHDVAFASYQVMEKLDNKEVKSKLEEATKKKQLDMHDVTIACAEYMAIKASKEVLK